MFLGANGSEDHFIYTTDDNSLRINGLQDNNTGVDGIQNTVINPDGGLVGIGTDNPLAIFHVKTSGQDAVCFEFNHVKMQIYEDNNTPEWVQLRPRSSNTNGWHTGGFMFSNDGDSPSLAIRETGQVGIGIIPISSSSYKLEVAGSMRACKVIVEAKSWCDYVFATDYNLMSLYEVEQYIKTYNHLPEVPSEKEVLENGIDLSEMNALLLKKIEELTLYMIEQEKRIKVLEEK